MLLARPPDAGFCASGGHRPNVRCAPGLGPDLNRLTPAHSRTGSAVVSGGWSMNETDLIQVLRDGLWTSILVAGPALAVALVVSLGIALFQALTQVQEMTLT